MDMFGSVARDRSPNASTVYLSDPWTFCSLTFEIPPAVLARRFLYLNAVPAAFAVSAPAGRVARNISPLPLLRSQETDDVWMGYVPPMVSTRPCERNRSNPGARGLNLTLVGSFWMDGHWQTPPPFTQAV